MFRIVIADDEGIMRQSLEKNIKSEYQDQVEIMTAKTGREVIELCESFRPDIVFVDIQMPGLSGIQAIQEVQKTHSNIVFIIISAYDRFTYAQEAVNLGVMEYLTKPVNKQTIIEVCGRAMQQVEETQSKRRDDLRIREKLEIVVPMIESSFIYSIISEDDVASGENYLQLLDIPEEYGYLIILKYGEATREGELTNAVGSNVRMNRYYSSLREIVADAFDCVIGPVMGNRIVLYVPTKEEQMEYEQRVEIITRVRNMLRKLEQELQLEFYAGISDVRHVSESYASYSEALHCIRKSASHVVHVTDLQAMAPAQTTYPYEQEERLITAGLRCDQKAIEECAEEIQTWFTGQGEITLEEEKINLLHLLVRLEEKAVEMDMITGNGKHFVESWKELDKLTTAEDLFIWFKGEATEMANMISLEQKTETDSIIDRSLTYIKGHYSENLTLDDISQMVDISPYYFSKLFKQTTGENFIEYLTSLRMEKAKEFLSNKKFSVKEICSMCGYNDPNYFSRIFKKYYGVTPTEYRE